MKDIYLKFIKKNNSKDISGESLDAEHKDWLEISTWSQAIMLPTSKTASSAGGHTTERCEHAPMTLTKQLDKASVYLYEAASAGYSYDIEIQFFRASGTIKTNYFTVKLTNAIVSGIRTTISENGFPIDVFNLTYTKITWEHKGSKTDGSANVGRDAAGWDLSTNKCVA